jgi:hypothetical protein
MGLRLRIPKQCQNPKYTGIVCRSDNKPNGCFGVNSCQQGDLHRLNNCIDCNDKNLMRNAMYARRQYISSKLPVNQPKYSDLQMLPVLNQEYNSIKESYGGLVLGRIIKSENNKNKNDFIIYNLIYIQI